MLVTLSGITNLSVKPLQPQKASYSMLVTPLGIFTDVKLLHSAKVPHLISVTPPGMVTEVKPPQRYLGFQ